MGKGTTEMTLARAKEAVDQGYHYHLIEGDKAYKDKIFFLNLIRWHSIKPLGSKKVELHGELYIIDRKEVADYIQDTKKMVRNEALTESGRADLIEGKYRIEGQKPEPPGSGTKPKDPIVGQRISGSRLLTPFECRELGWPESTRCLALMLENGAVLFPCSDAEGNNTGVFNCKHNGTLFLVN